MSATLLNKAVVAQFLAEVFENFRGQYLDHLVTPDLRAHPLAALGLPDGPEGVRRLLPALRAAFANPKVSVPDMVAEGDRVVARYVFEADHAGELMGVPATGRRVRIPGILVARLREGKVAEYWREEDQWGLLQQIGGVPEAALQGA